MEGSYDSCHKELQIDAKLVSPYLYQQKNMTGTLSLDGVKTAWKYLKLWIRGFKGADVNDDNTIDSFELKEVFQQIGFSLNTDIIQRLVLRYGDENGKIHEDDFIQSFCRVLGLYHVFKRDSRNGKLTQDLSQWLSNALYV